MELGYGYRHPTIPIISKSYALKQNLKTNISKELWAIPFEKLVGVSGVGFLNHPAAFFCFSDIFADHPAVISETFSDYPMALFGAPDIPPPH